MPGAAGARALRIPPFVAKLARWWELPFLALVGYLMFRWRFPSYELNVVGDRVYYMGTDPYYHLRALLVSLENFPLALRFDPWTFFPRGTFTGQFGTLFDSLLAGAVLLLTGGEPTRIFAERALAVYPAVLGALTVVPTYFVAKRIFGNPGAAYAALVLAFLPGSFFMRSTAAHADHHVAEALASALAVLGLLVTIEHARRHEAALAAGWKVHRRDVLAVVGWGALGALAFAVYFWTWPPATLFVAVTAAALVLLAVLDHAKGRTSRATGLAAVVVYVGAALLVAPLRDTNGFEATFWTWTQPVSLLLAAVLVGAVAWGSEAFGKRLPGYAYGLGVLGFTLLLALCVRLVAEPYWRVLEGGFQWVTGIGYGGGGRTIAEARAGDMETMVREHGAFFYGALLGLAVCVVMVLRDPRPGVVVLLVWSGFMLVAAFNQVRFNYYLAVNVALLNGLLVATAARLTKLPEALAALAAPPPPASRGRKAAPRERFGWKQPAAIAAAAFFVLPGTLIPYAGAEDCGNAAYSPPWWIAKCLGPDREVQFWTDGLLWLRDNTPDPGLDLGARYDRDTFVYPETAYGVLSWWDYGHWTEVLAERAPVANPFQQAAPFASRFFTATSEDEAERMLAEWSPDHPVRYVLIDDASASTKFFAITVWAGFTGYPGRATVEVPGFGTADVPAMGDRYRSTMMARLYRADGEGTEHWRLVHEERQYVLLGSLFRLGQDRLEVRTFGDILDWGDAARIGREYGSLNYRSTGLVCEGGAGTDGRCASGRFAHELETHSALKIFEHVAGARVVGDADPGETVTAVQELRSVTTGRSFLWEASTTADERGAWSIVVPYPTTGLLTPEEGGTNASVLAKGPWLFALGESRSPRGVQSVDVTERDVLEGRTVRAS